jgi:survival motor neuron protein
MANIGSEVFNRDKLGYDSDFLDDSALIKAFDNAVNPIKARFGDVKAATLAPSGSSITQTSQMKKKKKKQNKSKEKPKVQDTSDRQSNSQKPWHTGSRCRAVFSEDGLPYDAVIIAMDANAGTCTVRYDHYNNEEEQLLVNILPPSGRDAAQQPSSAATTDLDSADGIESEQSCHGAHDGFRRPHRHHHQQQQRQQRGHRPRSGHMPFINGCGWVPPPFMAPPLFQMPGMPPHVPPPCASKFSSFHGCHHSASSLPPGVPLIPPPPPPPMTDDDMPTCEKEALYSMLISWYLSGYHTGYYQGLKHGEMKHENESGTTSADQDESCEQDGRHTHCTGH